MALAQPKGHILKRQNTNHIQYIYIPREEMAAVVVTLTYHTSRITDIDIHPGTIAHITQTNHTNSLGNTNCRYHLSTVIGIVVVFLHEFWQIQVWNNEPDNQEKNKTHVMLVSPWSNVLLTIWTYQINRNNVDKLNSVNLTSLNSEKSKTDFIVSKRLSYHVWKEKEGGDIY